MNSETTAAPREINVKIIYRRLSFILSFFCVVSLVLPVSSSTRASTSDLSFGVVCTHGEAGQKRVALTFDDGPHKDFTPRVLDVLKSENVTATFFIVGQNAEKYPELVDRILAQGCELGNHTYEHAYLKGLSRSVQTREIDLCDDELSSHSEYCSHLLRPPGGLYDDNVIDICAERGYKIIIWSIDTRDWTGASAGDIEKEVLSNIDDGAIILMHDFNRPGSHTVEALSKIIPKIKELGYGFVTVSELIEN